MKLNSVFTEYFYIHQTTIRELEEEKMKPYHTKKIFFRVYLLNMNIVKNNTERWLSGMTENVTKTALPPVW